MLSLTFPFPSLLPFAGLLLSCGRVAVDVGLAASVLLRFAFRFLSVPLYDCVLAACPALRVVVLFYSGGGAVAGRSGEHTAATGGNLREAGLALFAAYCGKRGARQRLRCVCSFRFRFVSRILWLCLTWRCVVIYGRGGRRDDHLVNSGGAPGSR